MHSPLLSRFQPSPSAPLLFFGGPYSNLESLHALFARARDLGIPDGNLLCTGDLVAYCADAQAVVDEIRARNIVVVQGNCEQSLSTGSADCGCGFQPGSACELLSVQWYRHALAELDADSRVWMGGLPPLIEFLWCDLRWTALHGGLQANNTFLFASASAAQFAPELPAGTDIVVAGHCGIPFSRTLGAQLWHNAGVIGMPANDGTRRGWFSVAEPCSDGISICHHALAFDAGTASRKMSERGLDGYANALLSGHWPSLDVLPPAEQRATGRPLSFEPVYWSRARRQACA